MDANAKDVESSEQEDEYEEEEMLVELSFADDNNLQGPVPSEPGVHFKLIGATTAKPVLQLGEQMFTGQYVDNNGTTVIFEEDDSRPYFDPVFSANPENPLRYYASTRKKLVMSRIFIKENKEAEEAQRGDKTKHGNDGKGKQSKSKPVSAADAKGGLQEGKGTESDDVDDDEWETDEEM